MSTEYMPVSVSVYSIIGKKTEHKLGIIFLLLPAKGAKRPLRGGKASMGRNVLGAN